jgi:hypothetical protein
MVRRKFDGLKKRRPTAHRSAGALLAAACRIMTPSATDYVRCRWVTPTVFLDAPYWVEAEMSPWACIRDAEPRLIATTAECLTCARFDAARPSALVRPRRPDVFR